MTKRLRRHYAAIAVAACTAANADNVHFTNVIPECRMPAGTPVPGKYLRLAKRYKGFAWAARIRKTDKEGGGDGWERGDGSSMSDSLAFYRADLNNDGYCDWYINANAPVSTGGDRDSINTLYLGQPKGWLRIGAQIPDDKPDVLGFGKTDAQQRQYLFGEDLALLHETIGHVHYMISAFYERHVRNSILPGYRIYVWDEQNKTLRALDKWEPGSKAAAAYAYFKAQGARIPKTKPQEPGDDILRFDPDVEAHEASQACDRHSTQWAYDDKHNPVSPHLLARCAP
jgi:hypothetical protein